MGSNREKFNIAIAILELIQKATLLTAATLKSAVKLEITGRKTFTVRISFRYKDNNKSYSLFSN